MKRVILVDKLREGFLGQALKEGLLSSTEGHELYPRYRYSRFKEEALTLFLLYDEVIIPAEYVDYSAPKLEQKGHLRFEHCDSILGEIFSESDWYKNRDRNAFAKALTLVKENNNFVLSSLTNTSHGLIDFVSKEAKIPRLKLIDIIIDFGYRYYCSNNTDLTSHNLHYLLGSEIIEDIISEFEVNNRNDELGPIDMILFGAMAAAERVIISKGLSVKYSAPAAGKINHDGRYAFNAQTNPADPSTIVNDYKVVRQVFNDAGLSLPVPTCFEEAYKIKADPNFDVFRKQLIDFQSKMASGDIKTSQELLNEVRISQKHLKLSNKINQGLRYVTYSAIPTALFEAFTMGGLPLISTTISVVSTIGQASTDILEKKHKWVLFGK
ncbi:MAG: hypothetical protein RW306_10035 [Geobacteraceae bacterium]|nr:hypothetical protein [Geobacteraceae bacterium]